MCGITGFISNNFKKTDLVKMTDALSHRGPDASGCFFDSHQGVALGHRRLSILDLSENANQPMYSHCKRYIMVYNGEVYNFDELRKKIININWKTKSDTEVILEAFAKWKFDFINKLNGMFAIAIYDKIEGSIHLFRDRMGIKPLYYYHNNDEFIFASEIKAIKKLKLNLSIDHDSIYSYLHLGYIAGDRSIFNEIKKVETGTLMTFKNNKLKCKRYWSTSLLFEKKTNTDFQTTKLKLKELIVDSVNKRLVSDVPVGTFLSGGTDSSLITAIAQKQSFQKINTFSIGFKEAKYNESIHAKKVANYLNTNHTEFIISENEAINELEKIIEHMDEPFADSSVLPTMMVSKMARKYVTVCLSGDGGDEQFMGYGAYNWANRLRNPILWNLRYPIFKFLKLSIKNQNKRGALVFKSPKGNWKSHIFSQEQYLYSEAEIKKILKVTTNSDLINQMNFDIAKKRKLTPSESQALFDLNNYLVDDLLVKVDRCSMYSSLECRVPLLDHNIVEFCLNIDENIKIKNGNQKYLLKQILFDYIPEEIMDRPKWGFSIPLEKWLKKDLRYLIEKYLNEEVINEINVLNYIVVSNIKKRYFNGESYLYNRIWSLIVLIKFLKENVGQN